MNKRRFRGKYSSCSCVYGFTNMNHAQHSSFQTHANYRLEAKPNTRGISAIYLMDPRVLKVPDETNCRFPQMYSFVNSNR